MRLVLLAITSVAVALTTQKGALVAIGAVSVILCAPAWSRYWLLHVSCVSIRSSDRRTAADHRGPAGVATRRRVQFCLTRDADLCDLAGRLAVDLATTTYSRSASVSVASAGRSDSMPPISSIRRTICSSSSTRISA